MAQSDKTEKATPKRVKEARKKGQVARSSDLNGAVVLLVGIVAIGAAGASVVANLADVLRSSIAQMADPGVVSRGGIGMLLTGAAQAMFASILPIAVACAVAGAATAFAQVGLHPSLSALKPDFKRINPQSGLKNLFSKNTLVEGVKSVSKVAIVGAISALAVLPKITDLASLVGIEPVALASTLADSMRTIAMRAGIAYLLIGLADVVWQRYRHAKSLRMDKQEVKEEMKSHSLPPEVRSAMRRRAISAARARMMAAIPEADVIVTNPTHFAVALRYDGVQLAPEVVAKGQDLIAFRIRELAIEHDVPVISDPPLARALHASVEVGHQIPEELFAAVAQVLAYVYRVAAHRRAPVRPVAALPQRVAVAA
jgi:flagellar biosynthesis protein FlhB